MKDEVYFSLDKSGDGEESAKVTPPYLVNSSSSIHYHHNKHLDAPTGAVMTPATKMCPNP